MDIQVNKELLIIRSQNQDLLLTGLCFWMSTGLFWAVSGPLSYEICLLYIYNYQWFNQYTLFFPGERMLTKSWSMFLWSTVHLDASGTGKGYKLL